MLITNAQLDFSSQHHATQALKTQERTQITKANGDSVEISRETQKFWEASGSSALSLNTVRISDESQKNLLSENQQQSKSSDGNNILAGNAQTAENPNHQLNNDIKLNLLRMTIEMLTGKKINLLDASQYDPDKTKKTSGTAPDASENVVARKEERHSFYAETEETDFSAKGIVRTADGMEINFQINLSMSHSYYEEEHLEMNWVAKAKDPLVLNFAGNAAELSNMTFSFDFEANGQQKLMHALKPGSGFLVFDRNGDHTVNDGSELFGVKTGDGFAELAALDEDRNGWIDEGDSAFDSLYLWSKNSQGEDVLLSLKDAHVGAISLTYADTPFSLKNTSNDLLGQVRATGVFLKEDGSVGTVQRVDLVV